MCSIVIKRVKKKESKKIMSNRLHEQLDADFCQRALNAIRVAAQRDNRDNEPVLVHVALKRQFDEAQRQVQIDFDNKLALASAACYIIPDKPNHPATKTEEVVQRMFDQYNEKEPFLPSQFDVYTVRSFERHFGEYKRAKANEKRYTQILVDHAASESIKSIVKKSPLRERLLKKLLIGRCYPKPFERF